jgi:hypothetical protein
LLRSLEIAARENCCYTPFYVLCLKQGAGRGICFYLIHTNSSLTSRVAPNDEFIQRWGKEKVILMRKGHFATKECDPSCLGVVRVHVWAYLNNQRI